MQEYLYVLSRHENGTIYRFTSMARVIYTLVNREGRYVRFNSRWQPIHEIKDFDLLKRDIQRKKATIEFFGSNGISLPFIDTATDPHLGAYPQAMQRWQ